MEEKKYSIVYTLGARNTFLSGQSDFYNKTGIQKLKTEDYSMGGYPVYVKTTERLEKKELIGYLKDFIAFLEKQKEDVKV